MKKETYQQRERKKQNQKEQKGRKKIHKEKQNNIIYTEIPGSKDIIIRKTICERDTQAKIEKYKFLNIYIYIQL